MTDLKISKDILSIDDIKQLVDSFYAEVRNDELLKDIFNVVIQDRWSEHLEKMYCFWQTVLLGEQTYYGSPFIHHSELPITEIHFNRWLELFNKTVTTQFRGERAEEAKWRAEKMAQMFQAKIENHKNNKLKPIK